MNIGIIDYGMGNLTSVINSLIFLGYEPVLINDKEALKNFQTIILPGVGAFGKAMERLKKIELDTALNSYINNGYKLIGICLGMQLLFSESHEFGTHKGLGIIEGSVVPFDNKTNLRVPHVGWNTSSSTDAKFKEFSGDYYHVHSYYCVPKNNQESLFTTNYGISFCAGVKKNNNVFGFQFHPEKSQKLGLNLLDFTIKFNA